MKLGSLFDGSGGFPLAGHINGIEPIWSSEVEPYPIRVTKDRFSNMMHLGSVTEIVGSEIAPVDIITFGSPCQDLSVAGLRKGLKHEDHGDDETTRSGLFMEAIRIIKEMRSKDEANGWTDVDVRPRFAVWENVPGAFSSNKGRDFRAVLQAFADVKGSNVHVPGPTDGKWKQAGCIVGDGWSIAWRVYDAQYWGVPQRRKRIYLVADFASERAGEILFECESMRRNPSPSGEAWKRATDSTKGGSTSDNRSRDVRTWDARGNGDGYSVSTLTGDHENRITDYTSVICEPITYWDGSQVAGTLTANNANGAQRMPDKENFNCVITIDRAYYNQGQNAKYDPQCYSDGTVPTLVSKGPAAICVPGDICGVDCRNMNEYSELYPTLQAKPNGGHSLNFSGAVRIRHIVRRLTPTECARLQGFPDQWGHISQKDALTDEEYNFWLTARNTHAAINGKAQKEYTREQMLNWYNKLHTDSAEYKMWGNGIALPCAIDVLSRIARAISND